MKKILHTLMLIFFLFNVISCKNKEQFNPPNNVLANKNIVSFDNVSNATSYIIKINDEEIEISTNLYEFKEEGTYSFQIKARVHGYIDSDYSDVYTIIVKFLDYPNNITVENNLLTFDKVIDADSYELVINDEIINVNENEYLLPNKGIYNIKIRSLSNKYVDSEYSPVKQFIVKNNKELKYRYSNISTNDIMLDVNGLNDDFYLLLNDQLVLEENYYIDEENLYLKSSYLKTLNKDTHNFILETKHTNYQITIDITNNNLPYIYSTEDIVYEGEDVSITYDILDYNISSLTDSIITNDDYYILDNRVTIKKEFIDNYFNNNDNDTLILSVLFRKEKNTYLTFVYIKR